MGVIAGVVGAVAAVGGSVMNSMNASSAMGNQSQALASQEQLAQEQWTRYQTEFGPLQNEMVTESEQPANKQAGYLSAVGANDTSYANLESNTAKKTAQMSPGGTGNSGLSLGMNNAQEMGRIQGNAGLASTWDQNQWNKMMQISQEGAGLTQNALQGYGNASSGYGQQAGVYSNMMNQSASGVGSMMSNPNFMSLLSGNSGGSYTGLGYNGGMPSQYYTGNLPSNALPSGSDMGL